MTSPLARWKQAQLGRAFHRHHMANAYVRQVPSLAELNQWISDRLHALQGNPDLALVDIWRVQRAQQAIEQCAYHSLRALQLESHSVD